LRRGGSGNLAAESAASDESHFGPGFELTDKLKYEQVEIPDAGKAVATAIGNRPDHEGANRTGALGQAQQRRGEVRAAAVRWRHSGITATSAWIRHIAAHAHGRVSVRFPISTVGRRDASGPSVVATPQRGDPDDGKRASRRSLKCGRRSRHLRSADEQARVSMDDLQLSEKELAQGNGVRKRRRDPPGSDRTRNAAGGGARETKDSAVYSQRAARIDLAAALGDILNHAVKEHP